MKKITHYDIIIIGAGPAGLATALRLSSRFNIAVLERQQTPIDKACGEGIMPVGQKILQDLGILDHLDTKNYYTFNGVRYISKKNIVAQSAFEEGPGLGMRRLVLSKLLLDATTKKENIHLLSQRLESLSIQKNKISITTNEDTITANLLIGADGMRSSVSRLLKWTAPIKKKGLRWGSTVHFATPPQSEFVEVHMGPGIEAYITPCAPNLTCVAFLWHKDIFSPSPGKQLLPSLLATFPNLEQRFKGQIQEGPIQATGPLKQKRKKIIQNGIALVGDASGYLDAITGEGISLALEEAMALANVVNKNLPTAIQEKRILKSKELYPYKKTHKQITKSYLRMTSLALCINRHPYLQERFIKSMSQNPQVFQKILSMNMGTRPFAKLTPLDIYKFLRGLF